MANISKQETQEEKVFYKEGTPNNKELWAKAKLAAKRKFGKYPTAYAKAFAAQWYRNHGGTFTVTEQRKFDMEMLSEEELMLEKIGLKDRLAAVMGRDQQPTANKKIGKLLMDKLLRTQQFVNLLAKARKGNGLAWYQILQFLVSKKRYRMALSIIIPLLIKIVRVK